MTVHKTSIPFLTTIVVAATSSAWLHVAAQEPRRPIFKSVEAREAVREFDASISKLNTYYSKAQRSTASKYSQECERLKKVLIEKLQTAQDAATKDGDLDEAIKLRDATTEYSAMDTLPVEATGKADQLSKAQRKIAALEAELDQLRSAKGKMSPRIPPPSADPRQQSAIQTPAFNTPLATRAAKTYRLEAKEAGAVYASALVAARKSYLRELEVALSAALRTGNLDEANAINAEKRLINEKLRQPEKPEGDPAAELAKWQGKWSDGTTVFHIHGNQLAWGTTVAILKVVGFSNSAVAVDLGIIKGPDAGKITPAIFQLEGDVLKYCGAIQGTRPTEFRNSEDWLFRTWKRLRE